QYLVDGRRLPPVIRLNEFLPDTQEIGNGFGCQPFTAAPLRLREPVPAALSQKNSLSPCASELCLRCRAGTQPAAQCLCRLPAPSREPDHSGQLPRVLDPREK